MSKSCETCWRGPEPRRDVSACIRCFADPALPLYIEHEECLPDADEARIDIIGSNGNDGLHYLDPNVERVMNRLADRAAAGLLKYGTDTTRTDLTRAQWLRHAQEEALDFAVYLERLIAMEDDHA
jgi:hypothetical protein